MRTDGFDSVTDHFIIQHQIINEDVQKILSRASQLWEGTIQLDIPKAYNNQSDYLADLLRLKEEGFSLTLIHQAVRNDNTDPKKHQRRRIF